MVAALAMPPNTNGIANKLTAHNCAIRLLRFIEVLLVNAKGVFCFIEKSTAFQH